MCKKSTMFCNIDFVFYFFKKKHTIKSEAWKITRAIRSKSEGGIHDFSVGGTVLTPRGTQNDTRVEKKEGYFEYFGSGRIQDFPRRGGGEGGKRPKVGVRNLYYFGHFFSQKTA